MKDRLGYVFLLLLFTVGNVCGQSSGMVESVQRLLYDDPNITTFYCKQGSDSLFLERESGPAKNSWVMPAALGLLAGVGLVVIVGMVANQSQQPPGRAN